PAQGRPRLDRQQPRRGDGHSDERLGRHAQRIAVGAQPAQRTICLLPVVQPADGHVGLLQRAAQLGRRSQYQILMTTDPERAGLALFRGNDPRDEEHNMSMKKTAALLLSGMTLVIAGSAFARADNAAAERVAADRLLVTWQAKDPVDVYLSDRMDGDIASAKLISAKDDNGRAEFMTDGIARPYVLLRDSRDRSVVRVAERVLHLEQGSNFRDLGGYGAADGKTIRWGMIYRAGGSAMLTAADLAQVQSLGLRNLVDLRSDEERVLAPTKIDGVPYSAVGYSMSALAAGMGKTPQNGANLYRNFPAMLAPQLRIIFGMLKRQEGPLEYNCSAGQDRTG